MTMSRRTAVQSRQRETSAPVEREEHEADGLVRETIPARTTSGAEARRAGETALARPGTKRFGTAVRVLFGLIWLADVYFKWQASFLNGLQDVLHDGTMGQPSWLMPWFNLTHTVISVQPTLWAYGIAIVETGIALALLVGFARKVTYVGGAIWSLLIWTTAEGFGHMSSGVATDIGTAIIYVVVFLALLALDARGKGTRPYSLDAVIEHRLPWWRRVAETRG